MKIKDKFIKFLNKIAPSLLIIMTAILFLITFQWFHKSTTDHLRENNYTYIEEITAREALTFKTKLEDQLLMLESLAKNFQDVDFSDYNATKEAIYATQGIGDFKRITFATLTGSTINNNNTTSGNILKKDYFQEAISGVPTVSSTIEVDDDGEEVLVLAVPIEKNEEVAAVLTGTFNRTLLNELFLAGSFNGTGYSYVTDSDGNALVLPQNLDTDHIVFTDNFFRFLELADLSNDVLVEDVMGDFALGNTNIMEYEIGQQTYVAFYNPIGVHDWYSLSIVNADYIQANFTPFKQNINALIAITIVLFLILAACLLLYNHRLQKADRLKQDLQHKEKYLESVTANRHLALFEYEYSTGSLKLSGDVNYIIETEKEELFIKPDEFFSLIHPQDTTVLENFRKSLASPAASFTCELRLKCADGKYHWYQLQANLISSAEQGPLRILGNMFNVDATNKNPLIFDEGKNGLTGFYNKESFETEVNQILRNSDPKHIYGLYIIDPDGFTEINDIMGHETGDQILMQIAQRVATVFSDADLFGHINGDTFAVFLHIAPAVQESALALIEEKAQKLTDILTDTFQSNKGAYHLTTSVGVALFAKHGANCQVLTHQAFTALNYVKKANKGHYGIYSIEMEES